MIRLMRRKSVTGTESKDWWQDLQGQNNQPWGRRGQTIKWRPLLPTEEQQMGQKRQGGGFRCAAGKLPLLDERAGDRGAGRCGESTLCDKSGNNCLDTHRSYILSLSAASLERKNEQQ